MFRSLSARHVVVLPNLKIAHLNTTKKNLRAYSLAGDSARSLSTTFSRAIPLDPLTRIQSPSLMTLLI